MASEMMDRVRAYALSLPDVSSEPCWGEEGYFHRPPQAKRCLFLTISGDVLSLPVPRPRFEAWFGPPPARPRRGQRFAPGSRHGPFAPHPQYAWRAWVRAAAPADEAELLVVAEAVREAYGLAVARERP